MISILIVGESDLLRGALAAVLAHEPDLRVVADQPLRMDAVAAAHDHHPEVVVIQLERQTMDGLEVAFRIGESLPRCRVVLLTAVRTAPVVRRALAAGVWAMTGPDTAPAQVVRMIRQVAGGERVFETRLVLTALHANGNPLTERERAVLALAGEGLRSPEIARKLFLSPGTVRNYLSAATRKIGARTRLEALRRAREEGWL